MTRKAKWITSIGLLFLITNFVLMIGLGMKHGASTFPRGVRNNSGSYVIEHGKRIDFIESDFTMNYYQGMITWIAFPAFLCVVLSLYATGNITETNSEQNGVDQAATRHQL